MEDTTTDIRLEGETIEEALDGKGKPSESSPENKEQDTAPSDAAKQTQEEVPFHKHPRWKEMYEDNKALKERLATLESSKSQPSQSANKQTDIPDYWKDLYGDNAERTWSAHMRTLDDVKRQAVEETEQRLNAKRRQEQETQQQAQRYVEDSLSNLKAEGKSFDDNELLKVVSDYRPITSDGQWDFEKAYQILQLMKGSEGKEKSEARRKLASETTRNSSKGEPDKKGLSIEELRRRGGWSAWQNS